MEVQLTADQDDAQIRAMLVEAKAYANRAEFITEDEMSRRFEAMLQSFGNPLATDSGD